MFKTTNIQTLGTEYVISDENGAIMNSMQVITCTDIFDATLGDYSAKLFASYDEYLEKSVKLLAGFDPKGTYNTLWFATTDEEVTLLDVVGFASKHGYTRIILEHLEDIGGGKTTTS